MNKYFISLFLKENTVILPGFGALTAPNGDLEEIMFLPYLTMNDGKLADFIVETEGIDLQDAQNTIAKFIREIETNLSQGESFDIYQFGSFFKNDEGDITFTSWLKNKTEEPLDTRDYVNVRPDDGPTETSSLTTNTDSGDEAPETSDTPPIEVEPTIEFQPKTDKTPTAELNLENEPKTSVAAEKAQTEFDAQRDEKKKTKFGAAFWILTLTTLVLIGGAVYAVFNYEQLKKQFPFLGTTEEATPVEPEKKTDSRTESSPSDSIISIPIEQAEETEKNEASIDPIPSPEKNTPATTTPQGEKGFFLIGGVYPTKSAAEKKVKALEQEGILAQILPQSGGQFYLSMAHFTTRTEASAKLKILRSKGFKVWILEK